MGCGCSKKKLVSSNKVIRKRPNQNTTRVVVNNGRVKRTEKRLIR